MMVGWKSLMNILKRIIKLNNMNDKELNYLLTNFACDRLDELQIWLEEKDCDRQFIYEVIDASLNLSIKNVEEQNFRNKKLLEEVKNRFKED